MSAAPPKLDYRDQQKIVEQVRELALNYCNKDWMNIDQIRSDRSADALIQIFSRMMEIIIQRLNKVPDKNFLTFMNMVGTRLSPPRVARAPLTFTMAKGDKKEGFIRAGTQAATLQTREHPSLVFETESDITIIQPKLTRAVSLSPDDEKWTDHSKILLKDPKEEVEVFRGKDSVPHRLYLGNSKLFTFEEKKTITLTTEIDLRSGILPKIPQEWEVKWYYFDETLSPKPLNVVRTTNDDVAYLLKSGSITFEPVAGISEKEITGFEKVKGQQKSWKTRWIFAELMTSAPEGNLPEIKSITASIGGTSAPSQLPDAALFNSVPIDLTKDFYPFGERPKFNDTFYIGSKEVFSKEGANITIGITLSPEIVLPDTTSISLSLEFWDGTGWIQIQKLNKTVQNGVVSGDPTLAFTITGNITFRCPKIELKEENGIENYWIRFRIISGNYGKDTVYETGGGIDISGTGTITSSENKTNVEGTGTKFLNELRIGDSITADPTKDEPAQTRKVVYVDAIDSLTVNIAFDPAISGRTFKFNYGWIYKPPTYKPPCISKLTLDYTTGEIPLSILTYNDFAYRNQTYCLFNWDEVPGNNAQLIESLIWGFDVNWIREAIIRKIPGIATEKETISISDGKNTLSLILDDKMKKVYMTGTEIQTSEFAVNEKRYVLNSKKYPFPPFQPIEDKEPAFYLAFDQDIAKLPVTLFFALSDNVFKPAVPLLFDNKGPGREATNIALKDASSLYIGDFVEFRNPSGEIEKKIIKRIDNQTIIWEEKLIHDFSSDGSTISLSLSDNPPVLAWEYWNGKNWSLLSVEDKTENLTRKDIIQFPAPSDINKRYCFEEKKGEEENDAKEKEYYWIRARIDKGRYDRLPKLRSVHTNTVWASNLVTVRDEKIGGSNGQKNQVIKFSHSPVLSGQRVCVNELSLTQEERKLIISEEKNDKAAVKDLKDDAGNITGYRVRWHEVSHFFSSGPHSRHYIIDRINGTITFGDGVRGMIPPAGKNNIVCSYRYGGGNDGNNARAYSITKLKTAFPFVKSVTNHADADGGWDKETLESAEERGPQTIKHHERAVTLEDYEWLVRASPKVAKAKCLPVKDPTQRTKSGWVTVIIVPESDDHKPLPTQELIDSIKDDIEKKTSTHLIDRSQINMIGPGYIKVGVVASVQFTSIPEAKTIEGRIIKRLNEFFHPLHGGTDNKGRDFGRDVYISEVYKVIKNTDGVDYVDQLYLNASIQIYKLKINEITPSVVYPERSIVSIGKKFLFDWDEIPGKDSKNLKAYLTQNFGIDFEKGETIEKTKNVIYVYTYNHIYNKYLFSWEEVADTEEVPGKEKYKLITYLREEFGLDWLDQVFSIVRKIDNGITLKIKGPFVWPPLNQNYILIRLDATKTKADLSISTDHRTDKFEAKVENNKLNIYTYNKIVNNTVSIRFDDDPTRLILTIDNIRTDELVAKDKTKIYDRAIFSLAERLPLEGTDTLTVVGFKEGDNIILRDGENRKLLVVSSVSHNIKGDILECESVRSETGFPPWSVVETFDKRIKSFITEGVPANSDIINLKVAPLEISDKLFLGLRDDPTKIDSSQIKEISDKVETIFIDDNYLVYSGTHVINKSEEEEGLPDVKIDEIYNLVHNGKLPEFPYLINTNTREVHKLNNWKKNCHLPDIRLGHRKFIRNYDDLDMTNVYDYCRWCFGAELSKR
ncbi:MAG: putative baseplate assembly protein [Candidatus Methanoperedens sp.]|nr:putative baseplate assembly protein [Candidatus Methanoperedens sp.]MCZ7369701.1 putative baseplate assembly protein [Candidatus Methanoperedens sp.]